MQDLKSNFVIIISWNLNHVEIVEKNYGKMKEYVLSVDGIEGKTSQNNQINIWRKRLIWFSKIKKSMIYERQPKPPIRKSCVGVQNNYW